MVENKESTKRWSCLRKLVGGGLRSSSIWDTCLDYQGCNNWHSHYTRQGRTERSPLDTAHMELARTCRISRVVVVMVKVPVAVNMVVVMVVMVVAIHTHRLPWTNSWYGDWSR